MGFLNKRTGRHSTHIRNQGFIALISITLLLQVATVARADYNFHGIIVDDQGMPVSGVQIQVYDTTKVSSPEKSDAYYITSLQSGPDGSYLLPLYQGSFKLVYSKDGYVKQTKLLGFTNTIEVDLGKMTIVKSISLTLSAVERVASPGTILVVPLTITNVGDIQESVQLRTSSRENWNSTLLDTLGEVGAVSMKSESSAQLSLRVVVPIDASGSMVVNVTATGSTITGTSLKIDVAGSPNHFVTCQYPSMVTEPGASVAFKVTVINPYPYLAEVKFNLSGVPDAWNPIVLSSDEVQINSMNLPAGGSGIIKVMVDVPQTLKTNGTITLRLSTSLGDLVDLTDLNIIVQHRILALGIKTSYLVESIPLGSTASFPLLLTNPTEADESLSLSLDNVPAKWSGSFTTSSGGAIQTILIGARSSVNLYAVLKPSIDAQPSVYNVVAKMTSSSLNGNLTLRVELTGNTAMKLTVANLYQQINIGDTQTLQVTLQNTGYTVISYPKLLISPSVNTLAVSYDPDNVNSIPAGQSQVYTVSIAAQEGTAQGDYIVEIRGSSPEVLTDPAAIRVTVSASNTQTLIIAGLLMVAFASIVLVYRRYKRK
jgi:uncharacterized membrane protein